MSQFHVNASCLQGQIKIPPSKSHTLRAILFASLASGKSTIEQYLPSPDTFAMIEACRFIGANIEITPDVLTIVGTNGCVKSTEDVINAGNSGIVLRFCAAIGALSHHPVVLTGDHSIRHQRPMKELLSGLSQLGARAESMRGDGYAPIIIRGPLKAGRAIISGEDSQPVSALLIGAAFAEGPIELNIVNPGEKPWVNLTLDWFKRLGIPYKNKEYTHFQLGGKARYDGFNYTVPGDFSSAAFPLAAALITQSELEIHNIDMEDCQGDKKLIDTFMNMGASIQYDKTSKLLSVKPCSGLSGIKVDINDFIDAITILSVVACYANSDTHIYNAAIAKQKECNRIQSIANELRKMGAKIEETDDGLIISPSILKGAEVQSYQDHRMAMSLAVAGMGANGATLIHQTDCVSKTFPSFLKDFKNIGASIHEGV